LAAHVDTHSHGGAHGANTALQHHFDNMEQQREAGSIGMWVFLAQEIMFFGGLFLAYMLYRYKYPMAFAVGSNHLDIRLGTFNTIVLILSSLTMAVAVYYAQTGVRRLQVIFLVLTMILGATFLGVKAVEYHDKYVHNLLPVSSGVIKGYPGFHWNEEEDGRLPPNVTQQQVQLFYWIYFAMTGLHALHMIIGIGILAYLIYFAWRGRYSPEYHAPVEISGLYWHFVDIVWIFLFPMLYLLGRHLESGH
jgi:cytochrome c oxidase subunit III